MFSDPADAAPTPSPERGGGPSLEPLRRAVAYFGSLVDELEAGLE